MTDGILLAETHSDPELRAYDTIIIDEAHERSLNIDFLLGYLHQLLPRRPDLKLIVTSATIDAERFARHFGTESVPAPVLRVSGRLFPVEIRYRPYEDADLPAAGPAHPPLAARAADKEPKSQSQAVLDAVDELVAAGRGDVLVFLPGERRRTAHRTGDQYRRNVADGSRHPIRRGCRPGAGEALQLSQQGRAIAG
jgi:ATP-dependent helicase HrpA